MRGNFTHFWRRSLCTNDIEAARPTFYNKHERQTAIRRMQNMDVTGVSHIKISALGQYGM